MWPVGKRVQETVDRAVEQGELLKFAPLQLLPGFITTLREVFAEIARDYDGDAHAPALDGAWQETAREPHVAASGPGFSFVTLQRR